MYYDHSKVKLADVLTLLNGALTHMNRKISFDSIIVKVGNVQNTKKYSKWRALRLDTKGIGRIQLATLFRRYFEDAQINEQVIRTVQPSGVRLYSADCDHYIGAGNLSEFHEAIPEIIEEVQKISK